MDKILDLLEKLLTRISQINLFNLLPLFLQTFISFRIFILILTPKSQLLEPESKVISIITLIPQVYLILQLISLWPRPKLKRTILIIV